MLRQNASGRDEAGWQIAGSVLEKATGTLALRLAGAVFASAAFGLIVVQARSWEAVPSAVGFGFLFGASFIAGTGYRIILAAVSGRRPHAAASWSGATTGSALLALGLLLIKMLSGHDGGPVLLGFGVAINIAYLLAKFGCVSAGCCHADAQHRFGGDLRIFEIIGTLLILSVAVLLIPASVLLSAQVAIGGHLLVRMASRWMRGRWSWGWPPLRQPGAEIAPLLVLFALASVLPIMDYGGN